MVKRVQSVMRLERKMRKSAAEHPKEDFSSPGKDYYIADHDDDGVEHFVASLVASAVEEAASEEAGESEKAAEGVCREPHVGHPLFSEAPFGALSSERFGVRRGLLEDWWASHFRSGCQG